MESSELSQILRSKGEKGLAGLMGANQKISLKKPLKKIWIELSWGLHNFWWSTLIKYVTITIFNKFVFRWFKMLASMKSFSFKIAGKF